MEKKYYKFEPQKMSHENSSLKRNKENVKMFTVA